MKMMEDNQLIRLEKMYDLFEAATARFNAVCSKKCAVCCTCNVTVTSIEVRYLLSRLSKEETAAVFQRLQVCFPEKRYVPKMTTNMFARLCLNKNPIPAEDNDPSWGKCPFLAADSCTIYAARPFGCRAMISSRRCAADGYARVPPLVLTLQNVFLQVIEHLDWKGTSGNLSDMLRAYLMHGGRPMTPSDETAGSRLVPNEKIPALMVEPAHREQTAPVIAQLSALLQETCRPES